LDAKNVHSNWTKEEASEDRGRKATTKRDAVVAAGVEGKPGKTQITISEGTAAKKKIEGKKSTCGENVVTSNSGCPMPS